MIVKALIQSELYHNLKYIFVQDSIPLTFLSVSAEGNNVWLPLVEDIPIHFSSLLQIIFSTVSHQNVYSDRWV